ncbi:GNAT family N-acetyltransferase [Evansella cellulosilytica]|uniref:GCN5-related N-acetyltransferase n=1 Tax=Evansella cellulosilytica (strain ATCC 21833 / DSM 2522 / FERM P-1141 / JCM 9156 / N-4) TaxID=649639 RepID=E6U1P8_EVAC2|nr:GNAT family N-acetyltransferase [Evansella cellulosilytica]ADU30411.1 GCN5-related N-acetyltransferase [Evansella cellulosilytica DSM 2522]
MLIREIETTDSEAFIKLTNQIEENAEFMLWEPGERNIKREQQMKIIENISKSENATILLADHGDELVGYIIVIGGNAKRNRHSAYIVTGVLHRFRAKGIGTQLFKSLESWSKKNNIHRLELTVVTENRAGLSLYKKMGFEIEGTKRDSLLIDGEYFDEYYMSKLI